MTTARLAPIPTGPDIDTSAPLEETWTRLWEMDRQEALEWFSDEGVSPADPHKLRASYAGLPSDRRLAAFLICAPPSTRSGELEVEALEPTAEFANPGQILGYVSLSWSTAHNQDRAWLGLYVAKPWRRLGLGSAAIDYARRLMAGQGRSLIEAWAVGGTGPSGGEKLVRPTSGYGALPVDGVSAFMVSCGARLTQVEHYLRLDGLEDPGERARRLNHLREVAQGVQSRSGSDYEVISWTGMPDDPEAVAAMFHAFSGDIPAAEGLQPNPWDAKRVKEYVDRIEAVGTDLLWSAARDRRTGELVAYTTIEWPRGRYSATQEDTWVNSAHRGRRLGLWIKAINTARVIEGQDVGRPGELEAVLTWVAAENEHMLAINHRIGFTLRLLEGCWYLSV